MLVRAFRAVVRHSGAEGLSRAAVTPTSVLRAGMCTAEFELSQYKNVPQVPKQRYPVRQLSKREQALDVAEEDLPSIADHGFRFFTLPHQLDGRNDMVKQLLSTRTASAPEMRQFRRHQLIRKYRTHLYDTGSSRVQVALLTERIEAMQRHILLHNHDKKAKKEIEALLAKRRKLMRYMLRNDYHNYRVVVKDMGIRPVPVFFKRHPTSRGRSQPHKDIHLRNSRVKNRKSRGDKGH